MEEDLTKKAAEMLLKGATLLSEHCPYCKGVRVMKDGYALCISCGREPEKKDIPEEKIQTCLIFVDLRGGINTGKSDSAIDYGKRNVYGTFEEHLQKVLEWKKNPDEFIKELIEQPTQDSLHEAIKEKLAEDSK